MILNPQELILSTKLNLRLIDLDLSPELMGPIRVILLETITEVLISYEQVLRYWYNYINIYVHVVQVIILVQD